MNSIIGFDDLKSGITKAPLQHSALSPKPSSESGKSTGDEDSHIECRSTDLSRDSSGTDIDSVASSPRAADASAPASPKLPPGLEFYPVLFLLRIRAAICRDLVDSSALGYSTRHASACSGLHESQSAGEALAAGGSTAQPGSISVLPAASENSWAAQQSGPSGMQDNKEQIARSILNKLTLEFDSILSSGWMDRSRSASQRAAVNRSVTPETLPVPDPATPFDPVTYHREVSATLRALSMTRNVAAAVRRFRAQKVPLEHQEKEFADLLTRASEEVQGIARRLIFAFCAGLVAGGIFGSPQCLSGLGIYFKEIYPDLCDEVLKRYS
jgi:hypothetical protein